MCAMVSTIYLSVSQILAKVAWQRSALAECFSTFYMAKYSISVPRVQNASFTSNWSMTLVS